MLRNAIFSLGLVLLPIVTATTTANAALPSDCDATLSGDIAPSTLSSAIYSTTDVNRDYKIKVCFAANSVVKDLTNAYLAPGTQGWTVAITKRDLWLYGDPAAPVLFKTLGPAPATGTTATPSPTPPPYPSSSPTSVFRMANQYGLRFSNLKFQLNGNSDVAFDAYSSYIMLLENITIDGKALFHKALNLSSANVDVISNFTANFLNAPPSSISPYSVPPAVSAYWTQIRDIQNFNLSTVGSTALNLSSSSIGGLRDSSFNVSTKVFDLYLSSIGSLKSVSMNQIVVAGTSTGEDIWNASSSDFGAWDGVTLTRSVSTTSNGVTFPLPYSPPSYFYSVNFYSTWVGGMRNLKILVPQWPTLNSKINFSSKSGFGFIQNFTTDTSGRRGMVGVSADSKGGDIL